VEPAPTRRGHEPAGTCRDSQVDEGKKLLETGGPDAGDGGQLLDRLEGAVLGPVVEDSLGRY
jgi:hypothetical protein